MGEDAPPKPPVISTFEDMIQAAVAIALERRLGPANKILNGQIREFAIARLGRQQVQTNGILLVQSKASIDNATEQQLDPTSE